MRVNGSKSMGIPIGIHDSMSDKSITGVSYAHDTADSEEQL